MKSNILEGNTNKALISMSLPISIGMLSTFLFQVVDTYFVGKLGPAALTALSFSSTIYFLLVGLFIGLSVGVSIIIGKAAGAKEFDKVRQTTLVAIMVCLGLSLMFSITGIVFTDPIFRWFGAEEAILPLIRQYIQPLFVGIPLLTVGILAGGILRASGNVRMPEIVMGIAGIINLVFDYLLIFGKAGLPEMGIKGAAYATVASWVFVILAMTVLLIKDKLISLTSAFQFKANLRILKDIFKFGLPTTITQVVGPMTLMFLTYLLARQSSGVVAAYGVASRIEMLISIGILGVSTAITPFIAQNLGAKKQERINQAIAFGGKASVYIGLALFIVIMLFIRPIAAIFSADTTVVGYTSLYFYIVSFSYVFYGLYLITSSIFNGLQLPINSTKIMLVKSAFFVAFTLIGSFWGVHGIFAGVAASNILGGVYSSIAMRKEFKRTQSELAKVNVWQEYRKDFVRIGQWMTRLVTR
ncbi:hypothetical protein BKI52_17915 [marine bacterium AO1-C]|nr:hypothetical protein BKI52_17915 [marine bacterium AO1-C]